mgnify:CR=1 FL=1
MRHRHQRERGKAGVVGDGTKISDLHLPVKINGDLALFQALGSLLVEWDALDHDFIAAHTAGFEAWKQHVAAVDWDQVTEVTGLSRAQIRSARSGPARARPPGP